jgi:hypothetical protein
MEHNKGAMLLLPGRPKLWHSIAAELLENGAETLVKVNISWNFTFPATYFFMIWCLHTGKTFHSLCVPSVSVFVLLEL